MLLIAGGIGMLRVILAIVGTTAGLIFLLSFKTHSPSATATPPAAISGSTGSTSGSAASPAPSGTPSSSGAGTAAAKTVTGTAADTRYGPVQGQDHRQERQAHRG